MTLTTTSVLLAQAAAATPASGARLVAAALIGIALIVLLITRFKLHPFLGLTIGSLVVAAIAGLPVAAAVASYTKGFGDTAAGVGTLIALERCSANCSPTPVARTRSSTRSSAGPARARCRGRWRSSAR